MEDELDSLLSQVDCEKLSNEGDRPLQEINTNQPRPSSSRFASPITDGELEKAKKSAVPKNTSKSTNWAVKIWRDWSVCRQKACSRLAEYPTHLLITQPKELDYWLSKFVLEVRKENGDHYPPDTLYSICSGLLRYIRQNRPEINIFKSPTFTGFQRTLDGEMKRLRSTGLGVKNETSRTYPRHRRKPAVGERNAVILKFYYTTMYILQRNSTVKSTVVSNFLICPPDGHAQLIYTENFSKNNQGGLLHCKVKPKQVEIHEPSPY